MISSTDAVSRKRDANFKELINMIKISLLTRSVLHAGAFQIWDNEEKALSEYVMTR